MCASSRKLMTYSTYVPLKSIYLACCTPLPLRLLLLLLLCSLSPLFYTVADSTGTLVWNLFGIGMRVFKMQHMPLGVAQTADGGGASGIFCFCGFLYLSLALSLSLLLCLSLSLSLSALSSGSRLPLSVIWGRVCGCNCN